MSERNGLLFQDIFDVKKVDPDGKKFNKVSRIVCKGRDFAMDLSLDINSEIYEVRVDERYKVALASTLSLDGAADPGHFVQNPGRTLMDSYDYVMYGKIFKCAEDNAQMSVYASFGGLLLLLKGQPEHLEALSVDQRLYLLMRKV
eukprot:GILI01000125.1.p1 GENE.GILI01000125.1~~GILI01000125.1.p1  ORF type:complete len:162 (+),score=49.71 GILI01000125.1:52-486(+)